MGFGFGHASGVEQLRSNRASAEHNQLQVILERIRQANITELKEIQENIAGAIADNPGLLEDSETVQKVNAAYKRSQELLGIDDEKDSAAESSPETLH